MLRRSFLQCTGGAALAASSSQAPRNRLGLDTYSVRSHRWKAVKLLDYAAGLKLTTVQISSLGEYESLEPEHLRKVKEHADRLGIVIDAGIGSICPTSSSWNPKEGSPAESIARGLRVAKAVGANAMRCFLGSAAERRGQLPIEAHMEATIKVFRSVRSQVLDSGIKLALENHNGDMEAGEVKTVIEESGRDFVGVCLDTGNPLWLLEDPLFTLETLAPYVATSHIRDSVVYEHPRGAAFHWVALGDGSIDFKQFMERFRQLCPGVPMQMEIITGRPPTVLPFLEADFWKAFPKKKAADYAGFLKLVRNGHPFMGSMMIAGSGKQPPEYDAALKQQQLIDVERSVQYARGTLGVS